MEVYINGIGNISPQPTADKSTVNFSALQLQGNRYLAIEPDYSQYIDGKQIRRMSRIIKMGVASSVMAMKEASTDLPQAIIVGTSMGCLEDTNAFISKMVQYKEEMLSPTAFIHSTHNSIAAQIALMFQCKVYNSTYVHRNISFESALLDAMMLIEESTAENALAGGIDEITDTSFKIMNRLGYFKSDDAANENNFYSPGKGSFAGEGSTFFNLSTTKREGSYARLICVNILSFGSVQEIFNSLTASLKEYNINGIDLVLSGNNGDIDNDAQINKFIDISGLKNITHYYKHLCGDYATSTAFAMAVASEILKNNSSATRFGYKFTIPVNTILIYNHSNGLHQSYILLTSC